MLPYRPSNNSAKIPISLEYLSKLKSCHSGSEASSNILSGDVEKCPTNQPFAETFH